MLLVSIFIRASYFGFSLYSQYISLNSRLYTHTPVVRCTCVRVYIYKCTVYACMHVCMYKECFFSLSLFLSFSFFHSFLLESYAARTITVCAHSFASGQRLLLLLLLASTTTNVTIWSYTVCIHNEVLFCFVVFYSRGRDADGKR